ncbi:glycosyltransferase family 2 protein [Brevibacterium album]|uniref:glycosyltransferase family 2 protein n=1 Tax=Brevibacterium album TaxID=417948 RepID=UPI000427CCB6|nr:glycosyltransferase family 2 protein [Brevibacterium album]
MSDRVSIVTDSQDAAGDFARALEAGADWIWLLGPEDVPQPEALESLLEVAHSGDSVGLVGPRLQVRGTDRLASAGVTTTAAGLRVNPVRPGEVDQGQYVRTEDVYALDAHGLLVSADAAARLGPPASALPSSYRGIDYSRRARDAGHRVVLAPTAVVEVPAHAARALVSSPRPLRSAADARAEHRHRLSRTRRAVAWPLALGLLLTAFGAALGRLASNDPAGAGRWLRAAARLGGDSRAVAALRRTAPRTEPAPGLLAARGELAIARREQRETGADGTAAWWQREPEAHGPERTGAEAATNTGEELQSFSRIDTGASRSVLAHPLTWVLLALLAAGGVLGMRLLGPGALTGGALPRLDVGMDQILGRLFSLRHEAGLGSRAPADPLLAVLAVLAVPFLGSADTAVRTVLLLAPAAAALLMYASAGTLTRSRAVRALLALVWGAAPALLLSVTSGRIGTVLAWLLLPVAVRALRTAVLRRSIEASAAAGLALAVVCAGMPVLLLPALLLCAVLVLRTRRLRLLWTLAPVLALHAPWLVGALRHPDALLADPGAVLPYPVARSWGLLLGWPEVPVSQVLSGSSAGDWVWLLPLVSVPLLLAVSAAYLRPSAPDGLVVASTVLTVGGLSLAIAQTMTGAGITAARMVSAWPGAGLALLTLGACGLLASGQLRGGGRRGAELRPRSPLTRAAMTAAAASAVLVLAAVTVEGAIAGTQIGRTQDARLPVYAGERAAGPLAQRTLVLEVAGGEVAGRLARADTGSVLDSSTVATAAQVRGFPPERRPVDLDAADTALAEAVGGLTSGAGAGQALADLGVGFVVLSGEEGEDLEDASRAVSSTRGLTRLGDADQGRLWQVEDAGGAEPAWARTVDGSGAVRPVPVVDGTVEVPEGEPGRLLVLAEREGALGARTSAGALGEAEPAGGWAQTYALPGEAVSVSLSASPWWFRVLGAGAGLALLVCVVVALPIGRGERG